MRDKRNRLFQALILQSTVLLIIIAASGCEKYRIKKNYTGDFIFTSIHLEETSGVYCPGDSTFTDTITDVGTITWIEEKNLMINYSIYYYKVIVDGGNLSLITDPETNPLNGSSLDGQFLNNNEIEFTYHSNHSFQGRTSISTRTVHGERL